LLNSKYLAQLTVVICTFNRLNHLKLILNSLNRSEVGKSFKLLIVDNSDNDLTQRFYNHNRSHFTHPIIFARIAGNGVSKARNYAIENVDTPYILFIDDDCLILHDTMKQVVDYLDVNKPDALTTDIIGVLPFNRAHCIDPMEFVSVDDVHGKPHYISSTFFCVKSKVLRQLGGFDENYGPKGGHHGYGDDTKLEFKLEEANIQVHKIKNAPVLHFSHGLKSKIWIITRMNLAYYQLKLRREGYIIATHPMMLFGRSLYYLLRTSSKAIFKISFNCHTLFSILREIGVMLGCIKYYLRR